MNVYLTTNHFDRANHRSVVYELDEAYEVSDIQRMVDPATRLAQLKRGRRLQNRKRKTESAADVDTTNAFMLLRDPEPRREDQLPEEVPDVFSEILRRFDETYARSREVGRTLTFRVEVDPSGTATITQIEDSFADRFPAAEEVGVREPPLEDELRAARERGVSRAARVLADDDMLSAEDLAKRLGTTRVTVNAKRKAGQLLGLDGARRGYRFPVWQIDRNGKPYPEIHGLLERLGAPWAVYRFLVQRHGALDGLTGREALERGRGASALSAAEGIVRGDFG